MLNEQSLAQEIPNNLKRENLVAWCVVPFDAKQRGPEERAEMLAELGLRKLAYDWREKHVPTWEDELKALKRHGIELSAFWCSSSLKPSTHPGNKRILDFLSKHSVQTELWFMLPTGQLDAIQDESERLDKAVAAVRDLAEAAAAFDCQVGLYNHGGWPGKPKNMVAIMEKLNDLENVGIVYNFHHAHEDLEEFPEALEAMKPYLMCLNLNGMTEGGAKIIPLGQGERDVEMLRWVRKAGYEGPIGILDHRSEMDAMKSLQQNLDGLESLWQRLPK
ncbi:MAG: TIM barrel protein [Planctomycetota bacterium]